MDSKTICVVFAALVAVYFVARNYYWKNIKSKVFATENVRDCFKQIQYILNKKNKSKLAAFFTLKIGKRLEVLTKQAINNCTKAIVDKMLERAEFFLNDINSEVITLLFDDFVTTAADNDELVGYFRKSLGIYFEEFSKDQAFELAYDRLRDCYSKEINPLVTLLYNYKLFCMLNYIDFASWRIEELMHLSGALYNIALLHKTISDINSKVEVTNRYLFSVITNLKSLKSGNVGVSDEAEKINEESIYLLQQILALVPQSA